MNYGIQLYSVKDFMAKDVKGTIAEIGKMGYKVVEAAGGDTNAAIQLMLVDKIEELTKIQVEAIKNLQIDKITVWDSMSGEGGAPTTANFLSGMMKSIPPLNETMKMAGIQMPEFLGKEIAAPEAKAE